MRTELRIRRPLIVTDNRVFSLSPAYRRIVYCTDMKRLTSAFQTNFLLLSHPRSRTLRRYGTYIGCGLTFIPFSRLCIPFHSNGLGRQSSSVPPLALHWPCSAQVPSSSAISTESNVGDSESSCRALRLAGVIHVRFEDSSLISRKLIADVEHNYQATAENSCRY
jgi:hypothetical protein